MSDGKRILCLYNSEGREVIYAVLQPDEPMGADFPRPCNDVTRIEVTAPLLDAEVYADIQSRVEAQA